jgi:hypothetical protein
MNFHQAIWWVTDEDVIIRKENRNRRRIPRHVAGGDERIQQRGEGGNIAQRGDSTNGPVVALLA